MSSTKGTRSSSRLVAKAKDSDSTTSQTTKVDQPNSASTASKPSGASKRKTKSETMAPPMTPPPKKHKKVIDMTPEPIIKPNSAKNSKKLDSNIDIENRPVEPHMTNAPLLTPHGSKLVTYADFTADISPSKSGIPRPTTTTGQLLEEACAHLVKTDPRLEPYIKKHHCRLFSAEGLAEAMDPYRALVSGILSQQVSGAAAKSILRKFIGLFHGNTEGNSESEWSFPLPEEVAKVDVPFLRTAGLSQRKAEYVIGLSEKFASGELTARWLMEAPYDEMVEKLVAVRGLGVWSVEMFACFALKRMDVFSLGDLGVQRGVGVILGRDVKKLKAKGGKWKYATEKEMQEFAEPFAPYRSLLMWYMWKASDTTIEAVEGS